MELYCRRLSRQPQLLANTSAPRPLLPPTSPYALTPCKELDFWSDSDSRILIIPCASVTQSKDRRHLLYPRPTASPFGSKREAIPRSATKQSLWNLPCPRMLLRLMKGRLTVEYSTLAVNMIIRVNRPPCLVSSDERRTDGSSKL